MLGLGQITPRLFLAAPVNLALNVNRLPIDGNNQAKAGKQALHVLLLQGHNLFHIFTPFRLAREGW
jgi:hypothetical protein